MLRGADKPLTGRESNMSHHTLPWTFEEIGKVGNKSLEVEFDCQVSAGSPGSYWEPPEPPEVEFSDVKIVALRNTDGDIVGPASWHAPSWQKYLADIACDLAEKERDRLEESLLERIGDYEEAALEDYYDRKRDELRGC